MATTLSIPLSHSRQGFLLLALVVLGRYTVHSQSLQAAGCPFYSGFRFLSGKDHHNDDLGLQPDLDTAYEKCSQNSSCGAFNTNRWLLNAAVGLGPDTKADSPILRAFLNPMSACSGIWLKGGCPEYRNYTFYLGINYNGLAGLMARDASLEAAQVACDSDPACGGFNATGYRFSTELGVALTSQNVEQLVPYTAPPFACAGIYIRTECPQFVNFTLIRGKDHWGDDLGRATSLMIAYETCNNDPLCGAFNTNFWRLKGSAVGPATTSSQLIDMGQTIPTSCPGIYIRTGPLFSPLPPEPVPSPPPSPPPATSKEKGGVAGWCKDNPGDCIGCFLGGISAIAGVLGAAAASVRLWYKYHEHKLQRQATADTNTPVKLESTASGASSSSSEDESYHKSSVLVAPLDPGAQCCHGQRTICGTTSGPTM